MKTIYHDAILNFGKYKGRAAEDILMEDPGYFLWCFVSETYDLDTVILEHVSTWAAANKQEAGKVKFSAQKALKERGAERGSRPKSAPASSAPPASVTHDLAFTKSAEKQEAWGTW